MRILCFSWLTLSHRISYTISIIADDLTITRKGYYMVNETNKIPKVVQFQVVDDQDRMIECGEMVILYDDGVMFKRTFSNRWLEIELPDRK